jgi:Uma2 family endonuclease
LFLEMELPVPEGFQPDDPATWPRVVGRLEYVQGKLLHLPPCCLIQSLVNASTAAIVGNWQADHREFFAGANEVGIVLGGDARGAEAAVWRRDSLGPFTGKLIAVPPILVAEVAGLDEDEPKLREKAAWYLGHGVKHVWLVLPDTREVVVLDTTGERRLSGNDMVTCADLPGFAVAAERFFAQLR